MVILFAVSVVGGAGRGVGGGGWGGRGSGWGGLGPKRGFFPKEPLCPVRKRLWSMSVGGLFLHGKAGGVPPPYPPPPPPPFWGGKEGKREVFTSFSHPTRRQGRRTPKPLNP